MLALCHLQTKSSRCASTAAHLGRDGYGHKFCLLVSTSRLNISPHPIARAAPPPAPGRLRPRRATAWGAIHPGGPPSWSQVGMPAWDEGAVSWLTWLHVRIVAIVLPPPYGVALAGVPNGGRLLPSEPRQTGLRTSADLSLRRSASLWMWAPNPRMGFGAPRYGRVTDNGPYRIQTPLQAMELVSNPRTDSSVRCEVTVTDSSSRAASGVVP